MTQIVPLNKETYRDLKVDSRASATHDSRRFVQVIVKEFPLLLVHYPILFSKDADTGACDHVEAVPGLARTRAQQVDQHPAPQAEDQQAEWDAHLDEEFELFHSPRLFHLR